MDRKICVTINDYQRLIGLMEFSSLKNNNQEVANQLLRGLKSAKMMAQEKISDKVITMNSRLILRELETGREKEITIAYPHEANIAEGKISVISYAGAAVLGRHEGDIVVWRTPLGYKEFEIVKITSQPEAAGDYHL
jgi:regulator of nucleoside diphosphate kinase